MTRIYLDTYCFNRPFDDQTQDRIRLQTETLLVVVDYLDRGEWTWVSSDLVELEIDRIRDRELRERVRLFTPSLGELVPIEEIVRERGRVLEGLDFRAADALHVARAEAGAADVLLTTDDRLTRLAGRVSAQLQVRVANPLRWIAEALMS